MIARNMLAVLDNNYNAANPQKMTLLGAKRWNVQWSKRSNTYVAKKVNVKKTFSFREELMDATIFRLSDSKYIAIEFRVGISSCLNIMHVLSVFWQKLLHVSKVRICHNIMHVVSVFWQKLLFVCEVRIFFLST